MEDSCGGDYATLTSTNAQLSTDMIGNEAPSCPSATNLRVARAPRALPRKRLLPRGDIPIVSHTADEPRETCKFGTLSLNATMPRNALKVVVALTATMPHSHMLKMKHVEARNYDEPP